MFLRWGQYNLEISAEGYAPLKVSVSVTADTELKLQLAAPFTTTIVADAVGPTSDPSIRVYDPDEQHWSGREDLNLRPPGPEPDSSRY